MLLFARDPEPEPRSELPQPKSLDADVAAVGLAAEEGAGGLGAAHSLPQTLLLDQALDEGGGEVVVVCGAAAAGGGDLAVFEVRLKMESEG